jgi:hypothetical protein
MMSPSSLGNWNVEASKNQVQTIETSCIYLQILEGRTSKGLELYFHTLLGGVKKIP